LGLEEEASRMEWDAKKAIAKESEVVKWKPKEVELEMEESMCEPEQGEFLRDVKMKT